MAMFRRSLRTPPLSRNTGNRSNGNNGNRQRSEDDDRLLLLQWLHDQSRSTAGPWDLYQSRQYADLWYGARAAAERVRAVALEHLYRNRPNPGGSHPDPRLAAAFSSRAVLTEAAQLMGLYVDPSLNSPVQGNERSEELDVEGMGEFPTEMEEEGADGKPPLAWIQIYPRIRTGQRPPVIVIRTMRVGPRLLEHTIACLLGFWHHDYDRLTDPDAPPGMILLPRDPGLISVLHQYAIALLCLESDCPSHWHCQCNEIRARFNAPPPDHERPTGVFEVQPLEHPGVSAHRRRDSEPRFPYIDPNTWTSGATGHDNDDNDDNDDNNGNDPSSSEEE